MDRGDQALTVLISRTGECLLIGRTNLGDSSSGGPARLKIAARQSATRALEGVDAPREPT